MHPIAWIALAAVAALGGCRPGGLGIGDAVPGGDTGVDGGGTTGTDAGPDAGEPPPPPPYCVGGPLQTYVYVTPPGGAFEFDYAGLASVTAHVAGTLELGLGDGSSLSIDYAMGDGSALEVGPGDQVYAEVSVTLPWWSNVRVVLRVPAGFDGSGGPLIASLWASDGALPSLPELLLSNVGGACPPQEAVCGSVTPWPLAASISGAGTPEVWIAPGTVNTDLGWRIANGADSGALQSLSCEDVPEAWTSGWVLPAG